MSGTKQSAVVLERYSKTSAARLGGIAESVGVMPRLATAERIVVKPNLAAGTRKKADSGVVTNPGVLRLVLEFLLDVNRDGRVIVVESDSIGMATAEEKFRFQGYHDLVRRYDRVELVDLSRAERKLYPLRGKYFKTGIVLPKVVGGAECLVSLAKMKTHISTIVTGALKNQFGCLPDGEKARFHPFLPAVVADINCVVPPTLCIVDGCPGMEGEGPVNGIAREMDLLVVGADPVAVDATMCRVMGVDPRRVQIILAAEERGLGVWEEEKIELLGIPLRDAWRGEFRCVGREQRGYVEVGLGIQRLGLWIEGIGHMIHLVRSTRWAAGKVWQRVARRRVVERADG